MRGIFIYPIQYNTTYTYVLVSNTVHILHTSVEVMQQERFSRELYLRLQIDRW